MVNKNGATLQTYLSANNHGVKKRINCHCSKSAVIEVSPLRLTQHAKILPTLKQIRSKICVLFYLSLASNSAKIKIEERVRDRERKTLFDHEIVINVFSRIIGG